MSGYEPTTIERKWQEVWAAERTWEVPNPGQPGFDEGKPKAYVCEMLPYPSGEPHVGHLKCYAVGDAIAHLRRRQGFQVVHPMGYDAFGLPAENNAIKTGEPPRGRDRALDRVLPPPVPGVGDLDRLVAGDRHPQARLLPLDPVDLPAAVRARARLPDRGGGAVVPERRDGAGQRAGRRRPLRAVRHRGDPEKPRAVVLQDHRLRRPAARRLRPARVLARARDHDAAQLDRPLRGRRGGLPLRRSRPRLPGLHHPSRHALRRDVLRPGPGAPAAGRSWSPGRPPRRRCASTSTGSAASRPRNAGRRTARRPACRSGGASSTR